MTRQQAISYLLEKRASDYHPPADRMRRLMAELGDVHKGLSCVHIAGTNGKGSVSALVASVLQAAGYRTGLYTSPHLVDWSERVRIDGEAIPSEAICTYAARVQEAEERLGLPLAAFDRMTAVAFLHFAAEGCGAVVLEVGLGGLLDATNVIEQSAVSILTNIGLDHTQVLGSTVEEIAAQKAGIIKEGCPVVLYDADARVRRVVEETCARKRAALVRTDFSQIRSETRSLHGQTFSYRSHRSLHLPLAGDYQLRNAATALEAIGALKARGFALPETAIREGFAAARWPGRFELLREEPPFLVDGGHNPQCARALVEALQGVFGERRIVFLLGMMRDKDVQSVLSILSGRALAAVAVPIDDPRAMPPHELADLLHGLGVRALAAERLSDAAAIADELADGAPVCAFGSLYMTGEVRALFGKGC